MSDRPGSKRVTARWLARGLAAAGSLALLGTVLAGTAQAAYPGANGLIAFVRGGNIFTINPASPKGSLIKLTHDGHDSGPRWSPDGQRIAYLHRGNLWVMGADGSHKKQLTHRAPTFTDSRPTWSPNGKFLAFVKTRRGHQFGFLTRYNFATHIQRAFTTTVNGHLIRVAALPAPVAWAWALNAAKSFASFIAYEGAGNLCQHPHMYCLNALGFSKQGQFANGFPSALEAPTSFRLTDADWYPFNAVFNTDLLATQETCAGGHCTAVGLDLTIGASPSFPGAYQGVYSADGSKIAYVKNNHRGQRVIFTAQNPDSVQPLPPIAAPVRLALGTQPDWQPIPLT
jgi:hypothetical protein